ncbi:D-glycero-beta-D-manno-heptose 1-phosphate adenylyltransferase [Subtercola sp. Z020]|uniref:D-glycero-beta-D-manno-heptose 1-phosphate adenylyltransferase n=1 Tax=Subtercola sp. Z020 TaxID=2080582 RepID=UPI000CE75C66|nr:D-glycero-beta-D-manno-heptose 1-phosphate adenylyltransferase [Subtercola sp. Z020]PPF87835.1 D-glycero-beta-D-manno-heptose 1-phosphate adenylyltransferase [Subtercola sp. Z020]
MKVVVVGDVLLDVDIVGRAERLSPDAPVPVIDVEQRRVRAGGAGLVAELLQRDGCAVELVTVLSADSRAEELRSALGTLRVTAGDSGAPTPVKTRLRAGGHAIARFDDGCEAPPVPAVTERMLAGIRSADAVIVADYGRGLAGNAELRTTLAKVAATVPVVWDPHPRGAQPIEGATVVTPNLAEARAAAGSAGGSGDDAATGAAAGEALRERWAVGAVVVTLGALGAVLADGGSPAGYGPQAERRGDLRPRVFAAPSVTVADPCGAGDRFAATLARELGAGTPLDGAVGRAVTEAAEFLSAGGVARRLPREAARLPREGEIPVAPAARLSPVGAPDAAARRGTVTALETALAVAQKTRDAGGTVVATGGCFDILHAGHARTLRAARAFGDCLIVCLNSDESVARLKGPERPIQSQEDRAELLLSLGVVDAVMVFGEDTPERVLATLRPDVWVKGGDYSVDELPESRLLSRWGGRTVTVPFHPGRSTTKLAHALARVS